MNRQELKSLWFSLPTSTTTSKTIKVRMDQYAGRKGQGTIEIISDTPDGYSAFNTHQKHPLKYALNTRQYKSGEYQLFLQ